MYFEMSVEEKLSYEKMINYERERILIKMWSYAKDAYIYCLYDPEYISKICYIGGVI